MSRRVPEVDAGSPSLGGYDIVSAGGAAYIRKAGASVGYVTLDDGFPYWSAGVPRTRDGALKLPKTVVRAALVALGWQPAAPERGCDECAKHGNWCRQHGSMRGAADRAAIDADRALDARNEARQEAYERKARERGE